MEKISETEPEKGTAMPMRTLYTLAIFAALIAGLLHTTSGSFALDRVTKLSATYITPLACKFSTLFTNESRFCVHERTKHFAVSRRYNQNQHSFGYFIEPIDHNHGDYGSDDDPENREMLLAVHNRDTAVHTEDQNQNIFKDRKTKMFLKKHSLVNDAEVSAMLNAAAEFRRVGKYEKARKILEHAKALSPTHPDVLTEFGLFMEQADDNVIEAQSMYSRALAYNPWHRGAMSNRQRTLPLVEDIDNRMLNNIDDKREWFLQIPRTNAALSRAMRESYFAHVYHTVAMEGNTMSLVQTRSILETRMAVSGKSVIEHQEILGMDAALRYLNRTLVHRIGHIDIQDILEIHKRVFGYVDPMQAGIFRDSQVYVGKFTPTDPKMIQNEMDEFIEWLNADETLHIHPVELAALAHYKFVYIHPFVDGNGRTARLLMNLILMQAGFPPVIIRIEDRLHYYETLKLANEGDLRPFIRLIASATERTLDDYISLVRVGGQRKSTDCASVRQTTHVQASRTSCDRGDQAVNQP